MIMSGAINIGRFLLNLFLCCMILIQIKDGSDLTSSGIFLNEAHINTINNNNNNCKPFTTCG